MSVRKTSIAYLFLLPTLVYLIIFQLYPLVENLRLSFTDLSLINRESGQYIGFENYEHFLFNDYRFWTVFKNTIIWVFGSVLFQFLVGVPSALLLNKKLIARGLWRGLILVPWVTPVIVMGIIWKWIFDGQWGILNYFLKSINFISNNIVWLGNESTVWPALLLTSVWKGFPYITLMILAGLQGINKELYEAAKVDGGTNFRILRSITLPMLRPTIFVSALVALVTTWTKFELIWALTEGGPGISTSTLAIYIYTNSFVFYSMGKGSTIAVLSTIIVTILSLFYVKTIRRSDT